MAKTKPPVTDGDEHDVNAAPGGFLISYMQGDEEISLSFLDAERRDAEAARLRGMGIVLTKTDA